MSFDFKHHFESLADFLFAELLPNEQVSLNYSAEESYFARFNHAKVRQNGSVQQADVSITLWKNKKTYSFAQGLTCLFEEDCAVLAAALEDARKTAALLPDDPYQSIPTGAERSETAYSGSLIPQADVEKTILEPVRDLDFTGIFAQGLLCRGAANTAGARHWFQTETFSLDYSVWLENGRAVKGVYAGREWNGSEYERKIAEARKGLTVLALPQKKIEPGKYRMFISADALTEVVEFFSWNGFGERCMQQGESAYLALKEGRETFSNLFNLTQDFSIGVEPAFNGEGEAAPEKLVIIEKGKLVNTVVSSRSEKQYGTKANGAPPYEGLRSAVIGEGTLAEADALKELGTGIYISNFHYLNWSDTSAARITGMTRFACLWVEDGKVVAPIADMRWDESLYNIFGANLVAVTKERHLFADTSTYDQRSAGGCLLPGILVKDFNCTL
ncbi:MAG: metallopeptidase TldD-related protein [Treponema sp.]